MTFTYDDFAYAFRDPAKPGITGSYTHFPLIKMLSNESDAIKVMVTFHERAHQQLNNSTLTGVYLIYVGQLANVLDTVTQQKFKALITKLVNESRICHEVYATFLGMSAFRLVNEDTTKLNPLAGNGEYSLYYELGCQITQSVKGAICKEAFLAGFCCYCFNSVALVDELFSDPLDFSFSRLQQLDLPDKRLQFLLSDINELDAQPLIDSYIEFASDMKGIDILIKDRANELLQEELILTNDHFIIINGLSVFVIEALNDVFGEIPGPAYGFDATERKIPEFTELLRKHFPEQIGGLALGHFDPPVDYTQQQMASFESEKIQLQHEKPAGILVLPEFLNNKAKADIFNDEGGDSHIMLQCLIPLTLKEQYDFKNKEDLDCISALITPCVVLRYPTKNEAGDLFVYVIPFEQPAVLEEFLKGMPDFFPVYGLFYFSAYSVCFTNPAYNWIPFFKEKCWSYYLINDISLFLFIDDFKNQNINSYTWTELSIAGVDYAFLFFMVNNILHADIQGDVEWESPQWVIVPGTKAFILTAHQYIQNNFPEVLYNENDEFLINHIEYSRLAVEHVFTEDYIWGFKNHLVNLYLKNKL